MTWFNCEDCGDTVKKPKVPNHLQSCSASRFSCIDCGRTFDRHTVGGHNTCVSEQQKYAQGATKPGGFAAEGYFAGGQQAGLTAAAAQAAGLEYLATRAPWRCSICNVTCTSQDTLTGHASGLKHRRKVRAAGKAVGNGQAEPEAGLADEQAPPAAHGAPAAAGTAAGSALESEKSADGKKAKKRKLEAAADEPAAPEVVPSEGLAPKKKKAKQLLEPLETVQEAAAPDRADSAVASKEKDAKSIERS
ncbi:hypothetical protein WJX84_008942 [Apatococcus fuscideae]|uniref:Zinc finger C2H2 LYAR-type domain-containing protein n=1 Tax=Apatococcus fuscideae TaxID=2026836 RepID=A0AAW1T7N6_9CHLO